ncbi:hypothetical protein [Roseimicrobium sp. ORNL1]|uniref:hypothetical protein n=1 Tax=Roseimicrobium sp. ORNL1 TaxID=2711231 RepID=UPI0013E1C98A|nr:hypothetical protein [Roseimicrobium sp. ORNL1]QIF02096.1 hypothetical protein G5S37_11315 [Roseimicrobium sp. ORNL1]
MFPQVLNILGSLWAIATLVTWGGLAVAVLTRLGLARLGFYWMDPKALPGMLRVSSRAGLGALGCLLLLSALMSVSFVWSSWSHRVPYLKSFGHFDYFVRCGYNLYERLSPIGILAAITLVPTGGLWLWENRMRRAARG